ncbi:MAG: hypothetical protein O7C74_06375 [Acidobacteria bacterium]|nr:hypothetical protein [Acidobacteriota bacterium]
MKLTRVSILPLGFMPVVYVSLGPLSSTRAWAKQKWKKVSEEEMALTEVEIFRSRIEPDAFGLLKTLSVELNRANKRRISLRCP